MLLGALGVGEKFSLGGITTLLGLGMTFVVLALLIGCVYLINIIVKQLSVALEKLKNDKLEKKSLKNSQNSAILAEETSEVKEESTEPSAETMVAIEAAVRTYLRESDGAAHENIKIKSVTKL